MTRKLHFAVSCASLIDFKKGSEMLHVSVVNEGELIVSALCTKTHIATTKQQKKKMISEFEKKKTADHKTASYVVPPDL